MAESVYRKDSDETRQPPVIIFPPKRTIGSVFSRITRTHLTGLLIFFGLLSFGLLITVIVREKNRGQNNINTPISTTNTPISTTDTPISTTNNPLTTNPNVDQYCFNQGCVSAAAHQLRFMDRDAFGDRCTDFYTYACGNWQRTHPIQSFDTERTILGDIVNRRDEDIERLLDSPISRITPDSWEWKVKTYYTECTDDYARVPNSGKAMVDLIHDEDTIKGWFLFDNNAEDASQEYLLKNQSIYEQMAHIHGDLGANVVFGIRVRFDDLDPSTKRLEFHPDGLTMDVNDYVNSDDMSLTRRSAYRIYVLEVLSMLCQDAGVSDGNLVDRMDTVYEDILAFETFIAETIQFSKASGDTTQIMTLSEMSNLYSFDFPEFMTHTIGDPSIISGSTSVYNTNPIYFKEVFKNLAENDDFPLVARRIHNYMRWRLVHTYIDDLSYNFVHAHRIFLNSYYDHALHSTNDAYCTREVIRRFPLAIQRLYTMNSPVYPDAVTTVQGIFNKLKYAFIQYINSTTWMADETTKTYAREKIQALNAAIGYASIASDDQLLDDYYKRFAVDDKSHFENAYGYHRFRGWLMANSLVNPSQLEHWDLFETRSSRLFDYIAMFNQLFVIASAMHQPLVDANWPWAMNTGTLGVLLAQKMFASIDGPDGRTHDPSGIKVPDWWSTSTANAYNTSRKCITDYYVNDVQKLSYNFNGQLISVQLAGEPFSPTTLRHIAALRFAYIAMKNDDTMTSLKMPGTHLTSEQTFFLAYAQTQCYQRFDLLQLLRTQLGAYDEKTALNAALIHMPEFTQAFQCQSRDKTCF